MVYRKISVFELVLLIVGVTTAVLGFQLINRIFTIEKEVSWLMVIAIFNWLMLLVLFISLSLAVDVSKKQLAKMEIMVYLLNKNKGKK
jgi:high-affinity K+ transport system ATPase subunit B